MTKQEIVKKYVSPFQQPKRQSVLHKVVGADYNHINKQEIKEQLFSKVLEAKMH